MAGREFVREIPVNLPATQTAHDAVATLWARRRVNDLMSEDLAGLQHGSTRADLEDQITRLGLDFHLMTPFTSFVAVEEMTVTDGGRPVRVEVPVEMPEGVSYEGVFGEPRVEQALLGAFSRQSAPPKAPAPMIAMTWADRREAAPRPRIDPALLRMTSGKVAVQIALTDASTVNLEQLKKLGFELVVRNGRLVIGRLDIARLQEVARLAFVKYVGKATL
jgi:hypothetical protein